MNKRTIFSISIIVNIILCMFFLFLLMDSYKAIYYDYLTRDTIEQNALKNNIEQECYGITAYRSRSIRVGAEIPKEVQDYYVIGEYADLLFLKEIHKRTQNNDTANDFESRLHEIRNEMPEYKSIFDSIDKSVKKSVKE